MFKKISIVMSAMLLAACLGSGGSSTSVSAPGAPTGVSVAMGTTVGTTASVSFTAPASNGGSAITGYTVTANPGGITASGTASPITVTGLTPQTAYTYTVVAANGAGSSAAASTGSLNFYKIVETFHEPMTQPNDTIFTGSFTYDATNHTVSNLTGSLTQSMTKPAGCSGMMCYGSISMTTVALNNQLSAVPVTLGGVVGLLVTTFALNTTDTFDGGGFAPGGTQYFGLSSSTPNNNNAYAMVFINLADPTTTALQAQIDKLAYADCTPGGMMMSSCMTGTTVAGYGVLGTMSGTPVSQVITKQ